MLTADEDKKRCDAFFAMLSHHDKAYVHRALNFIAIKADNNFEIIHGRVFLNTDEPKARPQHFRSENVRAGRYTLAELGLDLRGLVSQLLTGSIPTPHGPLLFPSAGGNRHATTYDPLNEFGLRNQVRYSVLTILGKAIPHIQQPELDWEIKAASPPYDGLQEIINELALGGMITPTASVEIVAFNVAVVDGKTSSLTGDHARVETLIAKGLEGDKVTLGYRVYAPPSEAIRGVVLGSDMHWTESGPNLRSVTNIDVPPTAVINCTVSYDGLAESHLWLSDPARTQNSRRAVFETFDPKLESLKAVIVGASGRGQDARILEAAVAWLLWLLGFGIVHLGGTPRTRDAADIIATTPGGHFAVIECTTGLLKAENKLALLHARASGVRQSLAASNSSHLHVLPVIVTSRSLEEIKAELESAERLGILVIAREMIDQAIERTIRQPNADQVYAEAEQQVAAALTKYESQPSLPLAPIS